MTIEQRLAEIIQAFFPDALSSAVNLERRPLRPGPGSRRRLSAPSAARAGVWSAYSTPAWRSRPRMWSMNGSSLSAALCRILAI